jgi:hypothetical protein
MQSPHFAFCLVDAKTIEFDWSICEETYRQMPTTGDSDEFTFGGAVWCLSLNLDSKNGNVSVRLKRGESARRKIAVAFNLSVCLGLENGATRIIADENFVAEFQRFHDERGLDEACSKTQFIDWYFESTPILFRVRLRLANGIFYIINGI